METDEPYYDDQIKRSDFEYGDIIGEGGCGTVYKATFKKNYNGHTEAAAKVITTQLRKEEIDILRRLQHDNVVTLIGYFEDGPTKVIFLDYTQFGSLDKYLSKDTTPLPVELQRRWAKEAALAIQYLHNESILHRDVKASNCLLFKSPTELLRLKLSDFGLAKDIDHSQTTSTQKGTYRFWAPEIIRTDDRNHAIFSKYTDVWAYGMLVYEICTRRLPFFNKEWQTVIRYVGKGELLPSIPEDCPGELSHIMRGCWKFEARERPSINTIVQDLTNTSNFTEYWCLCKTLIPEHNVSGEKLKAHRIAGCPDGSIVVADNYVHHQRYMVNFNGEYIAAIESPDSYQINYIGSIEVTRKFIAFCDWTTPFVTVFNKECEFVKQFQAVTDKEDQEQTGLAADRDGNLVVWDKEQNQVKWYSCPEGEILKQMTPREELNDFSRLAINSAEQLIFYDDCKSTSREKVIAVDNNTGKKVFSISPQIGERSTGRTYKGLDLGVCGLVTDVNDAIFIVMKVCSSNIDRYSGRVDEQNTGHIHRYSNTGEFQQCIKRSLHSPQDISMTPDGSLIVANKDSILIYSVKPDRDSQ